MHHLKSDLFCEFFQAHHQKQIANIRYVIWHSSTQGHSKCRKYWGHCHYKACRKIYFLL